MKAKFRILCSILLLTLIGISGNSCENRGILARINRDGMDFKVLRNINITNDFLYGESSDFHGHCAMPTERVLLRFSSYFEIIDFQGRLRYTKNGWLRNTPVISRDGNYGFHGQHKFFLNDDPAQEKVIPDEVFSGRNLMNVSDDNRYYCLLRYSGSTGAEVLIWDDQNQSHQILTIENADYNTRALFAASKGKIYYNRMGSIYAINPDGSGWHSILMGQSTWQYTVSRLIESENILLFNERTTGLNSLCKMDLDTHEVQVLADDVVSYDYAPYSKELYYIANSTVWCYNLESGLRRRVYQGKKHSFALSHGIACSWDGDYLFLAGKVPK